MTYSTLLFDLQDSVAHVTLNRPDAANTLNADMMQDLFDVMLRCDEDPAVRVVLLSGSGEFFCAGGDLKAFAAEGDDLPMYIKRGIIALHAAVSRMTRMSAPIIAAIQGTAAGAGAADSDPPHKGQKRASGLTSAPHAGQAVRAGAEGAAAWTAPTCWMSLPMATWPLTSPPMWTLVPPPEAGGSEGSGTGDDGGATTGCVSTKFIEVSNSVRFAS